MLTVKVILTGLVTLLLTLMKVYLNKDYSITWGESNFKLPQIITLTIKEQ